MTLYNRIDHIGEGNLIGKRVKIVNHKNAMGCRTLTFEVKSYDKDSKMYKVGGDSRHLYLKENLEVV